jgi:hypothetical protein
MRRRSRYVTGFKWGKKTLFLCMRCEDLSVVRLSMLSSELWRRVKLQAETNVSEEYAVCTFKIKVPWRLRWINIYYADFNLLPRYSTRHTSHTRDLKMWHIFHSSITIKSGTTTDLATAVFFHQDKATAFHSSDNDVQSHDTLQTILFKWQFNSLNKLYTGVYFASLYSTRFQMEFHKQGTSKTQRRVCSFVL